MSSLLDNSGSSTKRAMFFSLAVAGVAVILYLFAVQPCQDSIAKSRRELDSLEGQLRVTMRDLRDSSRVKNMLSEIETARQPFMDALLTPLLESWAMRAKSKLDPLAADVGLKVVDYAEMPVRALPLPKPAPYQLYARRPIRITARGSYVEIASFILRVEKMLPFVSLQSLNIKVQKTPETQSAEIVLEWPVKGALSTPPPGGGKR